MSESNEGIDNLLLLLTQRSGGIEKLLENFFTFLARKTDFYRPPDKTNESSLDHCVNLVSYYCRNVGMKYSELINKNAAAIKSSGSSISGGLKAGLKKTTSLNTTDKDSTRSDIGIIKTRFSETFERSESSSDSLRQPCRSESAKHIPLSQRFKKLKEHKHPVPPTDSPFTPDIKFNIASEESKEPVKTTKQQDLDEEKEKDPPKDTKEPPKLVKESPEVVNEPPVQDVEEHPKVVEESPKDIKEPPKDQDNDSEDESSPPPGNGGKTDWYEWTQTLSSLEVLVKLPEGTTSKNVKVLITTNTLSVKINNSVLFEGQLHDNVKSDECLWALVDNKILQISLEKRNRMNWWSTVIKGHPEIDVKKIVPEDSKLSDLDAETRSTVEKMMFDQRQKAAGLPTSSQQSQYEALERFKKAHPELDFSKANINFS